MPTPEHSEEYYVYANIPGQYHNESGFCDDMTCPCHEDQGYIRALDEHVQEGLASPQDADNIYRGKVIGG